MTIVVGVVMVNAWLCKHGDYDMAKPYSRFNSMTIILYWGAAALQYCIKGNCLRVEKTTVMSPW